VSDRRAAVLEAFDAAYNKVKALLSATPPDNAELRRALDLADTAVQDASLQSADLWAEAKAKLADVRRAAGMERKED